MDDAAGLRAAIELARCALEDDVGGPFGAVVVKDGVIRGRGRNRVLADRDPTAHAEVLAIRDAGRRLDTHDLSGCTVYASSEPCPMCLGALYWARVSRVVYAVDRQAAAAAGFDDAWLYEELGRDDAGRRLRTDHLPVEDAAAVMRAWAARPDRRLY